MRLSDNTILITGGTSGIGFELAAQLLKLGNVVIVTGRDERKIEQAQRELPGIHAFQSDVSDPKAIPLLCDVVISKFPGLSILINNAGIMRKTNLLESGDSGGREDISRELETDLIGPIRMVKQFLPHLLAPAYRRHCERLLQDLLLCPCQLPRSTVRRKQGCIRLPNHCVSNSGTLESKFLNWPLR